MGLLGVGGGLEGRSKELFWGGVEMRAGRMGFRQCTFISKLLLCHD